MNILWVRHIFVRDYNIANSSSILLKFIHQMGSNKVLLNASEQKKLLSVIRQNKAVLQQTIKKTRKCKKSSNYRVLAMLQATMQTMVNDVKGSCHSDAAISKQPTNPQKHNPCQGHINLHKVKGEPVTVKLNRG